MWIRIRQNSADPHLKATVMLVLGPISICSDVELPLNGTLTSTVLVVVLRRKRVTLIGRDFPLATQTSIDSGHRHGIVGAFRRRTSRPNV